MGFGRSVLRPNKNKKQTKKTNRNAPAWSYINVKENVYVSPRERDDDKNKNMTEKITKEIDFSKSKYLHYFVFF